MLRYDRLPHDIFTDTMIAGTVSKRGNKNAQVYTTSYGWCRAFPMTKKSDAHETLSLLFKRDGVPPTMIMDNALKKNQGKVREEVPQSYLSHAVYRALLPLARRRRKLHPRAQTRLFKKDDLQAVSQAIVGPCY